MKKRKLYFTRDTLNSDKKKTKPLKVKCSILLMKLKRQTSFKLAFVSIILLTVLSVISLSLNAIPNEAEQIENVTNNSEEFFIAFIALSISLFSTVMVIIKDIINSFVEFNGSFIIEDGKIKDELMKKITSTQEYKNKGYEWIDYNGENKYEISNEINKFLISTNFSNGKDKLKFKLIDKKDKFIIPNESLRALDHRIKQSFQNKEILFNSDLIRMSSDLLNTNEDTIFLGRTDFFSHVSTNCCVYDSIRKYNDVDYKFDGYRFSVKNADIEKSEKVEINNLKDSYCANSIGMSTLALTKDGKIVILKQGKTNESRGRLVPSGSGSAEFNTLKKDKDYGTKGCFNDLITYEMSREMLEEIQISKVNYKKILKSNFSELLYVKANKLEEKYGNNSNKLRKHLKESYDINNYKHETYLLGYCRFLHRSGKPDYIGVTKLDVDSSILLDYFNAYNERLKLKNNNEINETENAYFISKLDLDAPYESLLNQTKGGIISLQLKYIIDELVKIKKNTSYYFENDLNDEEKEFLSFVKSFFN